MPLPILYQDNEIIAVYKPSGLLVHRSTIDRYETEFAMQKVRDQINQHVYPVHRLDKPTDGVLLFALNKIAARRLTEQFQQHQVKKTYHAIVRGYSANSDTIDYPLTEQLDRMTDTRANRNKAAQPAVTQYRSLARIELPHAVGRYNTARFSLLEINPQTGRKHQIRRHMKHIFHPIIGDTTHGDGKQNQFFREQFNIHRLLLTATRLQLIHPVSMVNLEISCTLEDDFQRLIDNLEWNYTRR